MIAISHRNFHLDYNNSSNNNNSIIIIIIIVIIITIVIIMAVVSVIIFHLSFDVNFAVLHPVYIWLRDIYEDPSISC